MARPVSTRLKSKRMKLKSDHYASGVFNVAPSGPQRHYLCQGSQFKAVRGIDMIHWASIHLTFYTLGPVSGKGRGTVQISSGNNEKHQGREHHGSDLFLLVPLRGRDTAFEPPFFFNRRPFWTSFHLVPRLLFFESLVLTPVCRLGPRKPFS